MADGEDNSSTLLPRLIICLVAAASAAVIVTVYHCLATGHIRAILRFRTGRTSARTLRPFALRTHNQQFDPTQNSTSMENSVAELIPSHKYQKGSGLVSEHGGMCAVCLSEFEEGEELRTLPECMHSFHAECIDMWLYSHSNCPMCRTDAAPSPLILMHLLDSNVETPSPPPSRPSQQHNSHFPSALSV